MLDKLPLNATAATSGIDERLHDIEANQARLYLLCTALAELLRDKGLTTEAELLERVNEIDLRDGIADGRFSGVQIVLCPSCGNKTKIRHHHCIYCGASLEGAQPAVEAVVAPTT